MPLSTRIARADEFERVLAVADAADQLFLSSGLDFSHLTAEHPFVQAEHAHFRACLEQGDLHWAIVDDQPVGFAALGSLDGHAYLEQLAVEPNYARRGIGRALVEHACALSRARGAPDLLLTTYGHLAWNGPFYATAGFTNIPETQWGPQLRTTIAEQRAALPDPMQRVAMRRIL